MSVVSRDADRRPHASSAPPAPRPRLPASVAVALGFLALIDLPTRIGGSTSLSALVTLGFAGFVVLMLPTVLLARDVPLHRVNTAATEPAARRGLSLPITLWLFLLVVLAGVLAASASKEAVQNLCVYVLFLGTAAVTADIASAGTGGPVTRAVMLIGAAIAVVYLVDGLVHGFASTTAFTRRSFALVAVVIVAYLTPAVGARWTRYLPWLLLALIVLSGSRTAMVAGAAVSLGRAVRTNGVRRYLRVGLFGILMAGLALVLVTRYAPLRERFIGGDRALQIRGVVVNTEGRTKFWDVTWESARGARWLGRGAGTSQDVVRARFGGIGHPHNDYLRILHDFGVLGLTLWTATYVSLIAGTARRAKRRRGPAAAVHWGACFALLAVAICMVTDNVVVYPYVMAPLGAIVGVSYAQPVKVE